MRYYNYLTTPSGKKCKLFEISNREYLTLSKFLNGDNYEGFYEYLNYLINKSINDFESYDIVDKAYIYIAFYFYSIKASIGVKAEKFDMVEVPLNIILDSIENAYIKNKQILKFYRWDKCKIGYPTILDIEDDTININYVSGIYSIDDIELTENNKILLSKSLSLQQLNEIEYIIKEKFSGDIFFVKDQPGINDIKDNIINPGLFYSIAFIYKESLDYFYNMLYLISHYARISWESLLDMTPIELTILHHNFVADKEEQNKQQSKNKGSMNLNDPNVADSLTGY
jgi:hypothetical protein